MTDDTGGPPNLGDSFMGLISDDPEQNRRNLEVLLRTIVEMSSALRPQALLESIVDRALGLAGAERGFLLLYDRHGKLGVRVARDSDGNEISHDLPRSRSVPEEVAKTGKVRSMTDLEGEDLLGRGSIHDAKIRNLLCGPLRARGRTLGVLYVDSALSDKRFTRADRGLFKALCYELAFALELATLAHKEQALAIARGVQERLLPAADLARPGLEVHGVMRPCEEAGGDFYDYLSLPDGRLCVVLGDVTGHGIGAALLMATCRATLRAMFSREESPSRALVQANRSLCEDLEPQEFLSLFLAEVDTDAGEFRYARAGHASPLLFHGDSQEVSVLEHRGPPLGTVPGRDYALAGPVRIRTGDVLVLYTDGVEEARKGKMAFGRGRIEGVVRELQDRSARRIAEGLLEAVRTYTGESPIEDDLTVVVMRFL
jgi:hypothetical protein